MTKGRKKQILMTIKWLASYLSVLLILAAGYQAYRYWQDSMVAIANIEDVSTYSATELDRPIKTEAAVNVPATHNIVVPYAGQAPFSNWTVHQESCEEAAIYMYRAYLEKLSYPSNRVPETEADTAYRQMKAWQVANYGSEPDLTMTALGDFAKSYYGYKPTIQKNVTAEDIKRAIAAGHPVVVPVMTHSLENSMYGAETTYHVLLIKGYDATGVITNDAGVGNGPDHHYTWDILWQAIDAQTAKMNQGRDMLYLIK